MALRTPARTLLPWLAHATALTRGVLLRASEIKAAEAECSVAG